MLPSERGGGEVVARVTAPPRLLDMRLADALAFIILFQISTFVCRMFKI